MAALFLLAGEGDLARADAMLRDADPADADLPGPGGITPLIAAAAAGQAAMVAQLLRYGAEPDRQDAAGRTAAVAAAAAGHADVLARLGPTGAALDLPDLGGRTPLSTAAAAGHAEAVRQLLEDGADPTVVAGPAGMTPLHHAAAADQLVCAGKLAANAHPERC